MYEDYYMQQHHNGIQSGGGMPVFSGYRHQRGHGIGSVLSGLFRSAVPMIKRGLAFVGKKALKTGAHIASDLLEGKSFGESARKRVGDTIKAAIHEDDVSTQSGSGARQTSKRIKTAIEKIKRQPKRKTSRKSQYFKLPK